MKKKYAGIVLALLISCMALVFLSAAMNSGRGASASGLDATPATDRTDELLRALEATVTEDMALGECGAEEAVQLRALAREEPERARQLNFMAGHVDIYTLDAVKTALMGGDHIDFALELPFRAPDSSGLDASVQLTAGQIPYMSQYDSCWAYHAYGSSVVGVTGCGPTCLSMVYISLTGKTDLDPVAMARFSEQNGFTVDGMTAWALMTDGAAMLGLHSAELSASADAVRAELEAGRRATRRLYQHGALHRARRPDR